MAWCVILWKAIKVRRAFNRLKAAKRNSYRQSIGLPPIYPIYERPFRWVGRKLKSLALNTFCRCCKPRKGVPSCWRKLWTKGTLPNEILKSILGFIVGIFFSKLLLDFLTSQLNFHTQIVYWSCIIFGVVLTIGMTFSDTVRCLFILGIPQLFSSKGRAALLAYLLVLALSGPAKNTAMNMEVLTESLVCGQDMVRDATSELVALATEPLSALRNAVSVIIKSVQEVLERMHEELTGIIKAISEIVNIIKRVYAMLRSVTNMCNDKLGTPFNRCMKAFTQASKDCNEDLGSALDWMCSVVDVFENFCHFAKIPNLLFCWLPSLVKEAIFEPLKEHFKNFANGFKKFFDVRLNLTYEFDHELVQDKTLGDIARNMKADIIGRVDWFLNYVDWMDLFVSGCLFLVVWKAFTYRHKFRNSDEYDNYYITKGMIRMDLRRRKLNKASIFPLRYRECTTYVQTYSWALVDEERRHMRLALMFVGIAAIQILNYIVLDYLLYLFLELIRKYGSIQFDTKEALGLAFSVEGDGFLAQMYRNILNGLSPAGGLLPSFDTSKCLPVPHKPNYWQYAIIISLLFLTFLVATLEPYGLRLRHIVCGWIYEERIVKRETWLYLHILSRRDNFLDYAKSQLRARLKGDRSVFRISLMNRLAHTVPCCRRLFKTHKKKCFLCGRPGDLEDFDYFVECPNCRTVYCKECFNDMGQKCMACMKRIDYEELTDFSEELGSDSGDSDEDRDLIEICCSRLCRCSTCTKKYKKLRESEPKSRKIVERSKSESNTRYESIKHQRKKSSKSKNTKTFSKSKIRNSEKSTGTRSKEKSKLKRSKSTPKIRLKSNPPGKSQSLPTNAIKSKANANASNRSMNIVERHEGWLSMKFRAISSKSLGKSGSGLKSNKMLSLGSFGAGKSASNKKKFGNVKYQILQVGKSQSKSPIRKKNKSKLKFRSRSPKHTKSKSNSKSRSKSSAKQKAKSKSKQNSPKPKSKFPTRAKKFKKVDKMARSQQLKTSKSQSPSFRKQKSSKRSENTKKRTQSQSPKSERRGISPMKKRDKNIHENVSAPASKRKKKNATKTEKIKTSRKSQSPKGERGLSPVKGGDKNIRENTHAQTSKSEKSSRNARRTEQVKKSGKSQSPSSRAQKSEIPKNRTKSKSPEHSRRLYHEENENENASKSKAAQNNSAQHKKRRRGDAIPEVHKIGRKVKTRDNMSETRDDDDEEVHPYSRRTRRSRHRHSPPSDDDDYETCEGCQYRREWWKRHTLEAFRHPPKYIAPSLRERVDALNEFYDDLPYPPHCNL